MEIIENKRSRIKYVECFINGYYEDTSEVIFDRDKYIIDINKEQYVVSNTLDIRGINGSYKGEPTMLIFSKDGLTYELPCYEN